VIATATCIHNSDLYQLESSHVLHEPSAQLYALSIESSPVHTWHRRLGHVNPRKLHDITINSNIIGIPPLPIRPIDCATCLAGKQRHEDIPCFRTNRATQPLELVYTDVCGPFCTKSLSGARYFLLFIDDYSRRMWIFFL
jgi:hypothetical protein